MAVVPFYRSLMSFICPSNDDHRLPWLTPSTLQVQTPPGHRSVLPLTHVFHLSKQRRPSPTVAYPKHSAGADPTRSSFRFTAHSCLSSLQATTTISYRGLPQALCRCRPHPVMQQAVLLLDHHSLVAQSGASSHPRTVVMPCVPRAIRSTDAVLVAFCLIASGWDCHDRHGWWGPLHVSQISPV
jgi:hypothetical protein